MKAARSNDVPDFTLENTYDGPVCGIDEVGRGPLAGPVVAACVYIPEDKRSLAFIADIRDSKKLSKKKLACLFDEISVHCIYGIGEIGVKVIDKINILQASLKAMEEAFSSCYCPEQSSEGSLGLFQSQKLFQNDSIHALIDGNKAPNLPCTMQTVTKGDDVSTSIAAASIIAKVTRDRIMTELAQEHPHYGWERNAGYGTKEHKEALQSHGITLHHRKSFAPIKKTLETES